jgi:hypothetical protein
MNFIFTRLLASLLLNLMLEVYFLIEKKLMYEYDETYKD